MLITIEGIDGSGKSSLVEGLKRELPDLSPLFTREPGATWVGDQVRRAIAERVDPVTEALLFAADHAAHLATVVGPALRDGGLVISDRYTDSRYAYQSVMLDGVLTEPLDWLRAVHAGWTIPPDRTFLLVLPVEEALARLPDSRAREHFEEEEILSRVQARYLALAEEEPARFVVIDAMGEQGEICRFVAGEIRALAGSRRRHRRS
ncbi:MAG: dTMP kinase [Methanomicrobiales archaeon]|nr:dTMP kinase [Methanomicrobiales archaeon]MDD1654719.1 dTMP kinase [Methanomicrobiales archaeon]